jgi:hypothetical protein
MRSAMTAARPLLHATRQLALASGLLVLCQSSFAQERRSVPQEPPSFRELADGVLFRSVQSAAPAGAPYEVEMWEILVAKGRIADLGDRLPGGAILEVFAGTGSLRVGDNKREVGPGAIIRVDERTPLTFDNSQGEAPLEFRATLIRRRTP